MLKRIQNCEPDLPTLLVSLGLEKYISKNFTYNFFFFFFSKNIWVNF